MDGLSAADEGSLRVVRGWLEGYGVSVGEGVKGERGVVRVEVEVAVAERMLDTVRISLPSSKLRAKSDHVEYGVEI